VRAAARRALLVLFCAVITGVVVRFAAVYFLNEDGINECTERRPMADAKNIIVIDDAVNIEPKITGFYNVDKFMVYRFRQSSFAVYKGGLACVQGLHLEEVSQERLV
jgi:hypothetical protein